MSAYIYFFIRKDKDFIPLVSYSRNSDIYNIISSATYIPWEHINNITYDVLHDWIVAADSEINRTETEIKKIEKMFELSNSYTLSDAYGYASTIEEYNELIERIKGIKVIFDFMKDILDEYEYEEDLDVSNILYFGMEISNPTVDDIIYEINMDTNNPSSYALRNEIDYWTDNLDRIAAESGDVSEAKKYIDFLTHKLIAVEELEKGLNNE